jgi:hypothetical protein
VSGHEDFEQLCALAATGDLTVEEFARLRQHLYECSICRAAYREFHGLICNGLTGLAPAPRPRWFAGGFGLKPRFLDRMRKEGIELPRSNGAALRRVVIPAAVTACILVSAFAGYWLRGLNISAPAPEEVRSKPPGGELAALTGRVSDLERQLAEARAFVSPPTNPQPAADLARQRKLTDEINALHQTALQGKQRLEESAGALSSEIERLGAELRSSHAESAGLKEKLRETELRLARANQDLEPQRIARDADTRTTAQQQARLEELAARVREQSETIQRERELIAAGKDIRDLMGARNLRIVDVQDVGAPGTKRSIPGRIFYTQGKSLIFYAYDLQNRGNVEKTAFQVWGKRDGRSQPARSLGILYVDDAAQKRWVMKFEDPDVLAQIDQVFVTAEPRGGSSRPTGKQLLSAAFLNDQANHP